MNQDRTEITRVLLVPLACACLMGALLWPNWREEIYAQTYYCPDGVIPAPGGAAPTVGATTALSTLSEPVDCEESPYMCVDGMSRYLARVYADLLGRWPGPTEIAAARAAYPQGLPDLRFAQELVASPEYRHQVVQRLTQQLLGRVATQVELEHWKHHDHRTITVGIMESQEYGTRKGGNGSAWVAGVYQDLLDREAEPGELREALRQLTTHGRTAVVQALYDSEEHHGEQVDRVYLALFQMPPDPAGRAEWVRALNEGEPLEQIISDIIASDEYADAAKQAMQTWADGAATELLRVGAPARARVQSETLKSACTQSSQCRDNNCQVKDASGTIVNRKCVDHPTGKKDPTGTRLLCCCLLN